MAQVPQISDAEWEVMKALWEGGPLTAGQIIEAVAGANHWSPRTVKTLLNRLVKKGALAFEVSGRHYVYRAKVGRDATVRRETRSFLSRVFDGAVAPAVLHFIEQSRLTPDELAQLRKLLDDAARKEDRS